MQTQHDTDVLRWIDLTGDSSLQEIEKQILASRSSLLRQILTLESTLDIAHTEDEKDLRHLATVVEHTAHLMHETVDLLQVRRALMSAGNTVTLRLERLDLRII